MSWKKTPCCGLAPQLNFIEPETQVAVEQLGQVLNVWPQSFAHDVRSLLCEWRGWVGYHVPFRDAFDKGFAFRAIRIVLPRAPLERIDHFPALRHRLEQQFL